MWANLFRLISISGLMSFGATIKGWVDGWFSSSDENGNEVGVFGQLTSLVKWLIVAAVVYIIYTVVLGKKIKIGSK
jgi:hypothetical protein